VEGHRTRRQEEQESRTVVEGTAAVVEPHIVPVEVVRHIVLEDIAVEVVRMGAVDSLAEEVDHNLVAGSLEVEAVHMVVVQVVRHMVVDLEEDRENERAAERHIHNLVVGMPS